MQVPIMILGGLYEFPFNFTPQGVLPADGIELKINEFSALYSLMGTRFGGDGTVTFKVPNLSHPIPGMGYFIAIDGVYPEHQ